MSSFYNGSTSRKYVNSRTISDELCNTLLTGTLAYYTITYYFVLKPACVYNAILTATPIVANQIVLLTDIKSIPVVCL